MFEFSRRYFVLFILFLIVLAGCEGGSYTIIKGDIDTNENSIIGEYSKFSGTYFKKLYLKRNDKVFIKLEDDTKKGSLTVNLTNSTGKLILAINETEKVNEKKTGIKKDDNYKITVIGNNHKGSFNLSWDIR
ncbi:hypothetical protein JCM16358_00250 [Halanaerocella petrolearia]